MVVKIVDQFDLIVEHPKNDAPVTTYADGPVVEQVALQTMEAPAGQVQCITLCNGLASGLTVGFMMSACGTVRMEKAREVSSEQQPEKPVRAFFAAYRNDVGGWGLRIFPARIWAVHELVVRGPHA